VLLSDGGNNAGRVAPATAAEAASALGIKIYTIGVGKRGLVPYGVNAQGNPNLISDTFNDKDFQRIAKSTGGKYYYAKDAKAIANILGEIFK